MFHSVLPIKKKEKYSSLTVNYKCVENACYKVNLVKSPKPGCGTTLKGRPVDTGNKSYKV